MYIMGIDASAKRTAYVVLAPKGGEYDVAVTGYFSPDTLARNAYEPQSARFELAAKTFKKVLDKLGLNRDNTIVGIEHAAINKFSVRSMEVTLSAIMSIKTVLALADIPTYSVYPASWQALVRVKGMDSKESSELMMRDVYGLTGLNEDVCDAGAVAHWVATHVGERIWLGPVIRKLEEGVNTDFVGPGARRAAEDLWRRRYQDDLGLPQRKLTAIGKEFDAALEAYRLTLLGIRRKAELDPVSKIRVDGNRKAKSRISHDGEWTGIKLASGTANVCGQD